MDQLVGKRDIEWINVAKGLTIVLVVLGHAASYTLAVGWSDQAEIQRVWDIVSGAFRPIRMPLFFLVSGMLAAGAITRPREDSRHKRLSRPIYLYIVWSILLLALTPFDPSIGPVPRDIASSAVLIVTGNSPAWYFLGLAILYQLARITCGWSHIRLYVLALTLCVLSPILANHMAGHLPNVMRCALFFLAGARFKDGIVDFVEHHSPSHFATAFLVYAVAAFITVWLDLFAFVATDIAAVVLTLFLVKAISDKHAALGAVLTFLGKRTIGIYVFHFLVISHLVVSMKDIYRPYIADNLFVGVASPLLIALVALPLSVAAYECSRNLPLRWLFDMPRWRAPFHAVALLRTAFRNRTGHPRMRRG